MDPQRIPPEYWRDRLRKARAMGLNTIFPYIYWHMLEPEQGKWDNTGWNNVSAYFRIAQEEGLYIALRPGPYICGEREWGGFPYWLANIPNLVVRSYNQPFLDASRKYVERLAKDVQSNQISRGGNIIMVQVENEYGSYGNDPKYTAAVRDILAANFDNGTVLYTNDGTVDWTLEGGSVPGVLAEVDGDPRAGFAALRQYITDPSMKGPLLDGEYYTYGFDTWGASSKHNTVVGNTGAVNTMVGDLNYVLGTEKASISLYMFHGGTNFAFWNGALYQNQIKAFITSYDYSAPLDEAGRTTDLYKTFRSTISKYAKNIPEPPSNLPLLSIPDFDLKPVKSLFDPSVLGRKTTSQYPQTMEALGQGYGYTLYTYTHPATASPLSGALSQGDGPRDRVLIFVNFVRVGVLDAIYQRPPSVTISLNPGDTLQLLVENLGRVDYFSRDGGSPRYRNMVTDPWKGIRGNVSVGRTVLENWDQYTLPLANLGFLGGSGSGSGSGSSSERGERKPRRATAANSTSMPHFYRGSFSIPDAKKAVKDIAELDTYLFIPAGVKGSVFVNGFNLGRYWRIGPQQSLYLPGPLLKRDAPNDVVVLELEPDRVNPDATVLKVRGETERRWGNNVDEDCQSCT
ncbi:glycoside hydrolase family 35 protein [Zopfia rhizophila CBS 207.26]|uniref:Glycoside hydrolase family 35 protein n=1 Tax=Zopfia rhizophila CBS 207.26 TaxID=1314779 RepID=A0A6A6DEA6_9PEZI|nr:glycoside hydrolase family 35 protein [Zopfia rhizophila CBS 207.26]